MAKAIVLGASGSLGQAFGRELANRGIHCIGVSRAEEGSWTKSFRSSLVLGDYSALPTELDLEEYSLFVFTMGSFSIAPFTANDARQLDEAVEANLLSPMKSCHAILSALNTNNRRDLVFIGSTSAFAGFKNTAPYCSAKHGLRGLVSALNDEYAATDTRFWLASMGTVDNAMGAKVGAQQGTLLDPDVTVGLILDRVTTTSNAFEPEFTIRRRHT